MTAIQLYKFITECNIEYHWHKGDVLMMPGIFWIQSFYSLLSNTHFDDEGIKCTLKDGYLVFEMRDICEYYGIELEEVFTPEMKISND